MVPIKNPYLQFRRQSVPARQVPDPKGNNPSANDTVNIDTVNLLYDGLRDEDIPLSLYGEEYGGNLYDGLRDEDIPISLYEPQTRKTTILSQSTAPPAGVKPPRTIINPYKKKKKTFPVFSRVQSKDGMPPKAKQTSRKPLIIVSHSDQTGVGKGKLCSMNYPNCLWRLSGNRSLIPSGDGSAFWKFTTDTELSGMGKIDLKRMLIEIHLMKFFFMARSQVGVHYSCRDNKEAFKLTMTLLQEVEWEDTKQDIHTITNFLCSPPTEEAIQEADYNNFWDFIISRMMNKIAKDYVVPGRPTVPLLDKTPFSIGGYIRQYRATVKSATNDFNHHIGLVESKEINWNERRVKGQSSIFGYVLAKNENKMCQ